MVVLMYRATTSGLLGRRTNVHVGVPADTDALHLLAFRTNTKEIMIRTNGAYTTCCAICDHLGVNVLDGDVAVATNA